MVVKQKGAKGEKRKTWFVYDANGPLFSYDSKGRTKENFDVMEEHLKKEHPDLYKKAYVEKDPTVRKKMIATLIDDTLAGKLPFYINHRMVKLAHNVKALGGRNAVISDGEQQRLEKLIEGIASSNHPFHDVKSSIDVGSKKESGTWYKILEDMGVKKGDRFYGVEDSAENAKALSKAARDMGLTARVYLIDKSLGEDAKVDERSTEGYIKIGSEYHLERKLHRHLEHAKRHSPHGGEARAASHVTALFFISLALIEIL